MKEYNLDNLTKEINQCRKCDLYKTRNNPVVGDGYRDADVLFIGEAPGRNEDTQGKPFVGRAGKILDVLLEKIGLNRNQVYIGNIIKCRPPKNRNPLKIEIDSCTKFLDKQIELINPKIIVTLGNFSTLYIFEKFGLERKKISKVHGKKFNTKNGRFAVIPVYHPAVAVYDPKKILDLENDFKTIKECLKEYF